MTLYWNNRGQVACAQHAPDKGTDTWESEQWRRLPKKEQVHQWTRVCHSCHFLSGGPRA